MIELGMDEAGFVDEAKQMFDGDRLHGKRVAIAIGEVDEEGFIIKGHEDSSDLAPLSSMGWWVSLCVACRGA